MRALPSAAAALLALAIAACASPVAVPSSAQTPSIEPPVDCHAPADPDRAQFLVGYGSLMEDASRRRTSPNAGPAHPVEVAGYERGWFERGSAIGFSTTYLGVRRAAGARMNAVLYEVGRDELAATDARESSYCRLGVALESLRALDAGMRLPHDAQVWIYATDPRRLALPDARYPIVQSYVDVFLSGCLEQERRFHVPGFARRCVETTTGWSGHWVNDRIYPRRPFVFQPRAGEIDRLLSSTVPREFASIRLEAAGPAVPR